VSQWLLPATGHSPLARSVNPGHKDAGAGVHFVAPGLLQLFVLRHHQKSDEPVAVCPECGCTFGVGRSTVRHHTSDTAYRWLLASGSTSGRFQDDHRHPGLPVTVRHGYSLLVADCQLVSEEGSRQLRSATSRTSVVKRTYSNLEKDILQLQVRT